MTNRGTFFSENSAETLAGCPADEVGSLEWTFDLSGSPKPLRSVRIMSQGAQFDSGDFSFTLCGDNGLCASVRGLYINESEFRGCRRLTLRAEMRGGSGDNAWQHAQLFRQRDDDDQLFPLNVVLEFESEEEKEEEGEK